VNQDRNNALKQILSPNRHSLRARSQGQAGPISAKTMGRRKNWLKGGRHENREIYIEFAEKEVR